MISFLIKTVFDAMQKNKSMYTHIISWKTIPTKLFSTSMGIIINVDINWIISSYSILGMFRKS